MTTQIINVGTPLELPAAAPVDVRAAAVAMAYAIELMANGYKSQDPAEVKAADGVVSSCRAIIADRGWKLLGIVKLADNSSGWKLVAR